MKTRALAAVATCLLLAGCYQSKTLLLDLGQAATPFADGTWVGNDEEKSTITLSADGNHYLMIENDVRRDVVMTPLPGHDDAWAAAQADEGCLGHADDCEWEYALVFADGERLREVVPSCELDWPAISKDVAERNQDGDTCQFDDAAKLQHALAYVAAHDEHATLTYSKQ